MKNGHNPPIIGHPSDSHQNSQNIFDFSDHDKEIVPNFLRKLQNSIMENLKFILKDANSTYNSIIGTPEFGTFDEKMLSISSTQDSSQHNLTSPEPGAPVPKEKMDEGNLICSLLEKKMVEKVYLKAVSGLLDPQKNMKHIESLEINEILDIFSTKAKPRIRRRKLGKKFNSEKFGSFIRQKRIEKVKVDMSKKEVKVEKQYMKKNSHITKEVTVYFGNGRNKSEQYNEEKK